MADRTVAVTPERLPGWIDRFSARHGQPNVVRNGAVIALEAPDGAVATYDETPAPDEFGIVLARRGGYAVGLVHGAEFVASKCGTRYVQGKTKAGGWSQQRYARRRANQADALARTCAAAADRVFDGQRGLVVFGGGDRSLVDQVIAELREPIVLHRRFLDVRDPRHAVLVDSLTRARSIEVRLNARA